MIFLGIISNELQKSWILLGSSILELQYGLILLKKGCKMLDTVFQVGDISIIFNDKSKRKDAERL